MTDSSFKVDTGAEFRKEDRTAGQSNLASIKTSGKHYQKVIISAVDEDGNAVDGDADNPLAVSLPLDFQIATNDNILLLLDEIRKTNAYLAEIIGDTL